MTGKKKILVIDDEQIIHTSIKRILARYDFDVMGSLKAEEGLSMIENQEFDALITDLMMPGMSGLEMLEALSERGVKVPSIMITGYPTIKTAVQALRLGAVDYIPKPFTRKELLTPLLRALRRFDADSDPEIGEYAPPAGADESSGPPMPGDKFTLPGHSWCEYYRDGKVGIGVATGFLSSVPPAGSIDLPGNDDIVEQGYPGFTLESENESHTVFMPLSGRVVEVNELAASNPMDITPETWLIKILPSDLENEVRLLKKE